MRNRWVDNKALPKPEKDVKFEAKSNKEYKIEAIINSAMYGQQANNDQMLSLYYLVLWKGYPEKENTQELLLTIIYLWKLISIFYKQHPEKLTATSLPLDFAPPMARPTVLKEPKQKYDWPSKRANKRSRN